MAMQVSQMAQSNFPGSLRMPPSIVYQYFYPTPHHTLHLIIIYSRSIHVHAFTKKDSGLVERALRQQTDLSVITFISGYVKLE